MKRLTMTAKDRLIKELQSRSHLSPFQLELVKQYMDWMFGIGYDEGKRQNSHGKRVAQIKDGVVINKFNTFQEAANAMKVNKSAIGKAVRGEMRTCGGFKWRIIKESL